MKTLLQIALVSILACGGLALTVLVFAVPAAVTVGLPLVVIGVAAQAAGQMIHAMESGNSAERLVALNLLREILNQSPPSPNSDFADLMRPAVDACTTDSDQRVVDLANEMLVLLEQRSDSGPPVESQP